METSMAERIASIMDMRAISEARLLALAPQMRRHGGIDPFEHVTGRGLAAGMHGAAAFSLALGGDHLIHDFRFCLLLPLLRPGTDGDEVVLQPNDGISQRPGIGLR